MPSLLDFFLFVYQMNHTVSPKRVTFDSDTIEITEKSTGNLIEKVISNHATKVYEFSNFFPISPPTNLLTHANNMSKMLHERFGHSPTW